MSVFEQQLQTSSGLNPEESKLFVEWLHRLNRVQLAEVAGYALGRASMPRHTFIPGDALQQNQPANKEASK